MPGDKTQRKLILSAIWMESPVFLRTRPKMSHHTKHNIEKGIESGNSP